jgi:hypothetical protein
MAHSSTVLTGSSAVRGRLVALLATVVPIFDDAFGLVGGYFDEISSALGVLRVPGELFDVVGSVFLSLHLL